MVPVRRLFSRCKYPEDSTVRNAFAAPNLRNFPHSYWRNHTFDQLDIALLAVCSDSHFGTRRDFITSRGATYPAATARLRLSQVFVWAPEPTVTLLMAGDQIFHSRTAAARLPIRRRMLPSACELRPTPKAQTSFPRGIKLVTWCQFSPLVTANYTANACYNQHTFSCFRCPLSAQFCSAPS